MKDSNNLLHVLKLTKRGVALDGKYLKGLHSYRLHCGAGELDCITMTLFVDLISLDDSADTFGGNLG